ncbi:GNAT family N-acetyltransferase [Anoxybacillus sp. J5B_2022]|uniref:GNAT family N-acetyltransferase n=1 Tax=Anoxybacillus sp. J5B_2022 TaxID=3003246 RepID=UPI002286B77E|nr:GNAT family N-acetyltransferase [Anoxybacillus sp. J5B_2022]MCZ0756140.1 GNAT family N-acetyltransferase [Anoxybacillus sp. J5B_2022]
MLNVDYNKLIHNGYEITELKNIVDFYNIKEEWEQLVKPSIYYLTHTYDWFYSTWKSLTGWKTVQALAIRKEEALISVIPLILEKNLYETKVINVPTSIVPFFASTDHEHILDCIIHYLNYRVPNWLELSFEELDFNFSESEILISSAKDNQLSIELHKTHETPILQNDLDFDHYFKNRSKKIKKALGNKQRKLSFQSSYKLKIYSNPEEIQLGLKQIFEVDCLSWKFSEKSDMSSREGQLVFYETLAQQLANKGYINLCVLELEDTNEPIAFEYLIICEDKALIAKHSYKQKYAKYSPGVILRYEILKVLLNKNIKTIDTWGFKDQFKMIWCNKVVDRYSARIKKKV